MRRSIEQLVTTPSTLNYLSENAYDYTKWNLGRGLIYDATTSSITPHFDAIRPLEESTGFAVSQIASYNLNSTINYIFGVESSTTASNTRRIHLWSSYRKTGTRAWLGFITLTLATATAHTVRDFKIDVKNESTGTVAVSGTTVTGTSTQFATNKVAVGARIGFGSTNPANITTWYRITARGSDTSLTLNVTPGTITAGTSYVIQEFRPIYIGTNATTTNGGIHYAKGVSLEDFTPVGTTIPLATTTDDIKAVYWLKDASTQTNIVAAGCGCDFDNATPTTLNAYVLDLVSAGNYKVYKYNLRAALTVASGASVSAFVLATGNNAITGTGSQNANCVFAVAGHGNGNGIPSLYFVSTTRFMRAAAANIVAASTTWIDNVVVELPPGGSSTFTATGALSTVEYAETIDSFIVGTTHTGGVFSYVTKFVNSGTVFDKNFGRDFKYHEQSAKDSDHPTVFNNSSTSFSYTTAGGNRIFACKQGTTALLNQIYVLPFGCDWDFAATTQGRLISPEINIANVTKFYRIFVNHVDYVGSSVLGKSVEAYRVYARTANIQTDESTGWTLINSANDLSSFVSTTIQFAIEFKTIGEICRPSNILGINIEYEDNTTVSQYALSVGKSDLVNKRFAFWFKTAFGGTVPNLRISLYNASTGGLLVTDTTTAAANGTWEKTTDGTTWTAYNTTDRGNATTWIRFTPTSIADNIQVEAYLTLA